MSKNLLSDLEVMLGTMPKEKKQELVKLVQQSTEKAYFIPNVGPQSDAYFSEADILLFGGQPGGGKSALINGLALNEHHNSLIVRRQFADLNGIVRDCREMIRNSGKSLKGFTMGNRPKYRKPGGGELAFEGVESNGEIDYGKQGVARDFIGIDEGVQLPLNAILMLYGWNRTTVPNQRCRMVIATNPPVNSTGDWAGEFFAPWLDEDYHNPAEYGELRYFYMDVDGKSTECESKEPFELDGKMIYPHSRTFVPSSLSDNPYLGDDYNAKLQVIPEPHRTILLSGNFLAMRQDPQNQVIPTEWIKAAIARREQYPKPPAGIPLCNLAVDIAAGGKDNTVIAKRYDWWFDDLEIYPGIETPLGRDVAAKVLINYRDETNITLDMSGGFGSGVWECLIEIIPKNKIIAFKGGENAAMRTRDGVYGFYNKRAAAYWKIREALDPSQPGGSPICFPNNKKLISQLSAPKFEVTARGIQITPKDKLIAELGYSPDEADAVVMCWHDGVHGITAHANWSGKPKRFTNPKIQANLGHKNRKNIRR